jgi:hypothetical protein
VDKMNRNLGRIATLTTLGFVALLTTATAPAAHTATAAPTGTDRYYYNFEQTIDPWTSGSEKGPTGAAVQAMKGDSRCPLEGQGYAGVQTSGDFTPTGAVWMAADFHDNRPLDIEVEWSAKDKGGCLVTGQPCQVEAYVGRTPPSKTAQFKSVGAIASDWTSYRFAQSVAASPTMGGDVYVAIGLLPPGGAAMSALLSVPMVGSRMGVDCLELEFESR